MSGSQDMETSSTISSNRVKRAYLLTNRNAYTNAFDREKFSSVIVGSVTSAATSAVAQ